MSSSLPTDTPAVLPRLRQAVVAAWDLAATASALRAELGLGEGFHDPGVGEFGLSNEVLPIGNTFFEVVSPLVAGASTAAGRFLARTADRGGYMAIFQVADATAARARIEALGLRIVWKGALNGIVGTHIHPADIGGAIVSIDAIEDGHIDAWPWAGPNWESRRNTALASSICGLELAAHDPQAMAATWAAVLDLPLDSPFDLPGDDSADQAVVSGASSQPVITLADGGLVRFRSCHDGEAEGIVAMHFATADPNRIDTTLSLANCEMRFVGR
jgi:Glyoxalase-like domain